MAKEVRETAYPEVLARRFEEYLGQLRRLYEGLRVSRLAQELGYADSRFLDRLSGGQEYFRWDEIDDFCTRSGLDAEWFKHGEGEPFHPSDACQHDVTGLLNELDPNGEWRLYFVRSDCRQGRVCFVLRDNDFVWRGYDTLLHLSAENGGGGARNLVGLYRLLREINGAWMDRTVSYTLPRSEFEVLIQGKIFPGAVLRNRRQCHWADDFPLLEPNDDVIRNLVAAHGPEFEAAQSIVRSQLERGSGGNGADTSGLGPRRAEATGAAAGDTCPVCRKVKPSIRRAVEDYGNRLVVDCPRCGAFRIGGMAVHRLDAGDVSRAKLSAWIRSHNESGGGAPTILLEQFDAIVGSMPEHGVADKQQLLLAAIGRRTKPSESAELTVEDDYGICWAESAGELLDLLRALRERGLIRVAETERHATCELTVAGWAQLDAVASDRRGSHQVFVAMSFDPDLETAWSEGIEPALRSAGYEPYRVDKDPHLERIDAKVHEEIDRSRFIVADMTGQRQGVYFEAGYALGQGMPVVWCVREDEVELLHFDTRQFNHVVWQEPADLRRKLAERVSGAIEGD